MNEIFKAPPLSTIDKEDQIGAYIQTIIQKALEHHASDIHMEPRLHDYRIRYRIDGLLFDVTTIAIDLSKRIVTRLKIMGQLDIAEKRLPQDGRIIFNGFHQMTIRINTCPSMHGEKLVLRLNNSSASLSLNKLGLLQPQYDLFYSKLIHPHGLILVTGPTGSGKTITLYSALSALNTSEHNIITIEDPIEIELSGTTQIQINDHIGISFSSILRSVLRQDPDIIMVGEIRDQETAALATHAANTGHLVMATLHANYAYDVFSRLESLGLAMDRLIFSISLIIAQRLVRKLCSHCKCTTRLSKHHPLSKFIEAKQFIYEANGCDYCYQGYSGQTAIFELLPMTDELANLMLKQATKQTILEYLTQHQWISLQIACTQKIMTGETSYQEYLRILGGIPTHVN